VARLGYRRTREGGGVGIGFTIHEGRKPSVALKLVIGSKSFSSWSLRPWLALEHAAAPYEEILISFGDPDWREQIKRYSPSGKVPYLIDGTLGIWDSLAIVEYLHEKFPAAKLWPSDPAARALARSVVAEMHSGFAALRSSMPMDLQISAPGEGHTPEALADAERVQEIWRTCRERHGAAGPYLFGAFSAADCFYAPVVFRFLSYGVLLDPNAKAYCDAMLSHAAVAKWRAAALREPHVDH
jgi:glutathione S-transferase